MTKKQKRKTKDKIMLLLEEKIVKEVILKVQESKIQLNLKNSLKINQISIDLSQLGKITSQGKWEEVQVQEKFRLLKIKKKFIIWS